MVTRNGRVSKWIDALYEYLNQNEEAYTDWNKNGRPGEPFHRPALIHIMRKVPGSNARSYGALG
jgi:hypothetical protein